MNSTPAIAFRVDTIAGTPYEMLIPAMVQGGPSTRTITTDAFDSDGTSTGVWECEPCDWNRMEMGARAEFFFVTAGSIIIEQDGGEAIHATPGTAVYSPPNWSGRWRVPERLTKVYFSIDVPNPATAA